MNALHSGDLGDCIAALPVIRHLGGAKLLLCNRPGTKGFSDERFNAIKLLLEIQPYIQGVERYDESTPIDHDFTNFRADWGRHPTLIGKQAVHVGVDPNSVDLSPWLTIPDVLRHGKIVLCRSTRYQGFLNWYKFWEKRPEDMMFCGFKDELVAFNYNCGPSGPNARYKPRIPFQPTANLLELASLIKGARLLVCNQGCPLWVALGIGTTPILMESVNGDSTIGRGSVRVVSRPEDNPTAEEFLKL